MDKSVYTLNNIEMNNVSLDESDSKSHTESQTESNTEYSEYKLLCCNHLIQDINNNLNANLDNIIQNDNISQGVYIINGNLTNKVIGDWYNLPYKTLK